jgi:hypothetical protein
MYNVLMDKLRPHKEATLKKCTELRFSNGGQYWAAATGVPLYIYDTATCTQLMVLQGHMMTIKRILWAPGDQAVFTAGLDGNVYGWPVAADARIDVLSANNRLHGVHGMAIDTASLVFPKTEQKNDDDQAGGAGTAAGGAGEKKKVVPLAERKAVIVSLIDGLIKVCPWDFDLGGHRLSEASVPTVMPGDAAHAVTTLYLSPTRNWLYAGTSTGALRIYPWPPVDVEELLGIKGATDGGAADAPGGPSAPASRGLLTAAGGLGGQAANPNPVVTMHGLYNELQVHSSAVVGIRESPNESTLLTVGEDGSVFVFHLTKPAEASPEAAAGAPASRKKSTVTDAENMSLEDMLRLSTEIVDAIDEQSTTGNTPFNDEVLMLSVEEVTHRHTLLKPRVLRPCFHVTASPVYRQPSSRVARRWKNTSVKWSRCKKRSTTRRKRRNSTRNTWRSNTPTRSRPSSRRGTGTCTTNGRGPRRSVTSWTGVSGTWPRWSSRKTWTGKR